LNQPLREARVFVAAYEERSFTAAAARENLTQSGVSQRIRQLEERIGARLFSRDSGTVSATPAGDAYYQGCLEVIHAHERAERRVQAFSGSLDGHLVVGLMPTMTRCILAPALQKFMQQNPNVALRVVEGYSADLAEHVRTGELAFAIVPASTTLPGIRSSFFASTPELVVSASQRGLPHLRPVMLRDHGPVHIVVPGARNARRARIESYLASTGVPVESRVELDSMFGTLDFVARSGWIAIVPGIMLVDDLDREALRISTLAQPPMTLDLTLIQSARSGMTAAAQAFLACLYISSVRR
jgi:LysR family nitrogen assimilation transcriptional regulator